MILVDYNQACIAAIMVAGADPKKLDENMSRHITLNMIRSYRSKYKEKYGEIVICADNRNYWRKEVFPYYTAKRKVAQAKSPYDWNALFTSLNKIRDEIAENFPFKVINVPRAEADDIIGTIAPMAAVNEKVLILSSDKDFLQLQKYPNITQYSPNLNRFITTDNPERLVKEHTICGERSDGVPNFLSADDVFMIPGGRQTPISKKKLEVWLTQEPEVFCDDQMLTRFKRNQRLVNLDYIPKDVRRAILDEFKKEKKAIGHSELTKYFMDNNLRNLFEVINEFK